MAVSSLQIMRKLGISVEKVREAADKLNLRVDDSYRNEDILDGTEDEVIKKIGAYYGLSVDTCGPAVGVVSGSGDFMQQSKALAKSKGITVTKAMSILSKNNPKLHEDFLRSCQ